MQRQANCYLRELYLDWVNNYLTVEKFAEHNEISPDLARFLIANGKMLHETHVSMLKGIAA